QGRLNRVMLASAYLFFRLVKRRLALHFYAAIFCTFIMRYTAFLSEIEFKVSKGYFFGIIVVNKSYQMEQQYELKEFLEFIERRGIKTFGIPSIDELTNTKITFIREDTAQLK
ncbi:hypothetical protein D478_27152, partial [Brevibacillus agri BAB-2500]